MHRIGLVTTVVILSAATACSQGSSPVVVTANDLPHASSSESSGGPPTATGGTESASGVPQAALITLDDLPAGWTTGPADNSSAAGDAFAAKIANCLHVDPAVLGGSSSSGAKADSPNFKSPDDQTAGTSETVSVESNDRLDAGFAVFRSPRLAECFDSLMKPYLESAFAKDATLSAATVGDPKTERLDFPKLGDDALAIRESVPISVASQTISIYVDFVYIRDGNAVAELSYQRAMEPFDSSTEQSIARTAFDKLHTVMASQ